MSAQHRLGAPDPTVQGEAACRWRRLPHAEQACFTLSVQLTPFTRQPMTPRGIAGRFRATLLQALALVSLLVLAGQTVLPLLHELLVEHRICAAHGELVHVDEARSEPQQLQGPLGYVPGAPRHQHTHCNVGVGAHREQGQAIVVSACQVRAPSATRLAVVVRHARALDASDCYQVAPKQGPPDHA